LAEITIIGHTFKRFGVIQSHHEQNNTAQTVRQQKVDSWAFAT